MSMPSASITSSRSFGVPSARVEVVGIAQRVAELLVPVHARVAEPGEPHRDGHVVLDQDLLGPELVVVAHPRSPFSHRRGKVALPEVDRLAHVAIGVDHHVRAAARELPHRCSPRTGRLSHPTQRCRDGGVNEVLVIGSEQSGQHRTGLRRRPPRLRRLVRRSWLFDVPGATGRGRVVPAGPGGDAGPHDGGPSPGGGRRRAPRLR